jgi:hypothetical protein
VFFSLLASPAFDCGLFKDLFLEESPELATETAAKKFTNFNSLT